MSKQASGAGSIRKKTVIRKGKEYTYWEARYSAGYDPGTGKLIRPSITGKTQKEVRQKLQEATRAVDLGTYQIPKKTTVKEWLREWLKTYAENTVKPYTLSSYKSIVKNHIIPRLGAMQLQELRGNHIQQFYNDLTASGLSGKTVKNISTVLQRALKQAQKLGYMSFNPCELAELPKVQRTEIHPLTDAEIPRFLEAAKHSEYDNAFAVCLFCGLREGELLGLCWDCVDFERGEIKIMRQLQRGKEKGTGYTLIASTKSGRSRTIKPPPITFQYLQAELQRQEAARIRAGSARSNEWDLVFTNAIGGHRSIFGFYKSFKSIVESIGRPDARPHDLRHTCATTAIAAGADIKSVQDLLGHATASFTLDRYAHASERMKQDTADRLQNYYDSLKKSPVGEKGENFSAVRARRANRESGKRLKYKEKSRYR